MQIIIDSLIAGAQRARGTVIIIDVFRAFTTEAIAFSRGAEKVILVSTPKDALELRDRGIADLCVGEVHGMTPEGFDHNNSPHEMSIADVKGKVLAHSTMAGTVGVNAATNADEIYVGSLVIARSTVDTILQDKPDLVTIVAMGDGGKIRTDEDEQCALYMRNMLDGRQPDRDAVRTLVMACDQAVKYDDPTQPHFRPEDRDTALEIDSVPFAIKVVREDGMLVSRPVNRPG
jgi:2-phosphosulfolactate phosphatase